MDIPAFIRRQMAAPLCTDEEAAALAARSQTGDAAAADELMARHARLAVRMAGLVKSRLIDMEERVQLALTFLHRSIMTFDPAFGVPFRIYAATQIRFRIWKRTQAEGRALRTASWSTHGVCGNTECASYGVVREAEPNRRFKCPDCHRPGLMHQNPISIYGSGQEQEDVVDPDSLSAREDSPVDAFAELQRLCVVAEARGLMDAEHTKVLLLKARGAADTEITKQLGVHRITVYRRYTKAMAAVREVASAS